MDEGTDIKEVKLLLIEKAGKAKTMFLKFQQYLPSKNEKKKRENEGDKKRKEKEEDEKKSSYL